MKALLPALFKMSIGPGVAAVTLGTTLTAAGIVCPIFFGIAATGFLSASLLSELKQSKTIEEIRAILIKQKGLKENLKSSNLKIAKTLKRFLQGEFEDLKSLQQNLFQELQDSQEEILAQLQQQKKSQRFLMKEIKTHQKLFTTELQSLASEFRIDIDGMLSRAQNGFEDLEQIAQLLTRAPKLDALQYAYDPENEQHRKQRRFLYSTDRVPFCGRENEIEQLQLFLDAPGNLLWWGITGWGGLGKSRLSLEFCHLAIPQGWHAGFLKPGQENSIDQWVIDRPTLIVVDEASHHLELISRLVQLLNDEKHKHPIRLLLLDRPQDEKLDLSLESQLRNKYAQIEQFRHEPLLSLSKLDEPSLKQTLQAVLEEYDKTLTEDELQQLLENYQQLDPQGRPLLAMFAAETIATKPGLSFTDWSAEDLGEEILKRELSQHWISEELPDNLKVDDAHLNLVIAATITNGLNPQQRDELIKASKELLEDGEPRFDTPTRRSINQHKIDTIIGFTGNHHSEESETGSIPMFLPSFLGELLVLDRLIRKLQVELIGTSKSKEETFEILAHCWQTQPVETATFLKSAFQNFPNHPAIEPISQLQDEKYDLCHSELTQKSLNVAYFNRALMFYFANKYDKAVLDYDQAINFIPDDFKVYSNRGVAKAVLGEHQAAIQDFNQAIRIKPHDEIDYSNRGASKANLGEQKAAIQDFNQAIRIKPDHAEAYFNRGLAKDALGEHQAAIQDCDQAIRIKPDYADAYSTRGNAKVHLGEHQAAILDYDQAIRIKPDHTNYYNRGVTKAALGEHQAAIQDYDQAFRIKPHDEIAYSNRGASKAVLGEHQAAIQDYDQAIRIKPDHAEAFYNRGLAKDALGEHQAAIQDYDQAININPNFAEAYYNRGSANAHLGEYQAVIQDLDQVIRINPNFADAYSDRGSAKALLGKYQAAIQDLDMGIKINPDDAKSYYDRGTAKIHRGKYQEAIQDFNQAIHIKPDYANAYVNKANSLIKLNRFEEANTSCEKALEMEPGNAVAYLNQGEPQAGLKNLEAARAAVNKALELGTLSEEHQQIAHDLLKKWR